MQLLPTVCHSVIRLVKIDAPVLRLCVIQFCGVYIRQHRPWDAFSPPWQLRVHMPTAFKGLTALDLETRVCI